LNGKQNSGVCVREVGKRFRISGGFPKAHLFLARLFLLGEDFRKLPQSVHWSVQVMLAARRLQRRNSVWRRLRGSVLAVPVRVMPRNVRQKSPDEHGVPCNI
jgi:hypothetical protein